MTLEAARERHKNTGRNDDCPCGSGKKYKKCHQSEDDATISQELRRLEQAAEAELAAKAAEAAEQGEEGKGETKGDETRKKPISRAATTQRGPKLGGAKPNNLPRRGAV